jgi:hypothetical protein
MSEKKEGWPYGELSLGDAELLKPVFEKRNHQLEKRPFDEKKKFDGNWNYIHETTATELIIKAYRLGLEEGKRRQ